MDGYLGKPIDPKALFSEVEEGLSHLTTAAAPAPSSVPAAQATPATAPAIDRNDLLRRLYGDEQLASDIVRLFVGECPTMVDAVGSALASRDVEEVRRAAHTLKGSASTAAAHGVADAARRLERLAAEGRLDALDDAWAHLSKAATMLLQEPPPWAVSSKENPCEP
jgi:HPt (histidine-containing phosphotransfer) domain-containing protein